MSSLWYRLLIHSFSVMFFTLCFLWNIPATKFLLASLQVLMLLSLKGSFAQAHWHSVKTGSATRSYWSFCCQSSSCSNIWFDHRCVPCWDHVQAAASQLYPRYVSSTWIESSLHFETGLAPNSSQSHQTWRKTRGKREETRNEGRSWRSWRSCSTFGASKN